MKWVKKRNRFLNEAKIRSMILPIQIKEVSNVWGEKYLDYEEVDVTDKIIKGKWKLNDEDKNKAFEAFFDCDLTVISNIFKKIPKKFVEVLSQSIDLNSIKDERYRVIIDGLDINSPSIDQIVIIYEPVFRKLNITETNASEMVQRDPTTGRPIMDESGKIVKVPKTKGDAVFTNNLVNIISFADDYSRCYKDDVVDPNYFRNNAILNLKSMASIDENREYKVDFKILDKDIYLNITHDPKDILNMSISKFYSSCQHLYSGCYREMVLSNVFDPNSCPAFLTFETPIYWGDEKISDQLPLSRMMLRNIESFSPDTDDKTTIFFDRAYPDRMKDVFDEIVEKYSGNKASPDASTYIFSPDVDITDDDIKAPYMDRLGMKTVPMIGKNIKSLYLNRIHDWSEIKISPNAKVREIVIETESIPNNLFDIPLKVEWIKFKYLNIFSLENFSKIKMDAIAFDKCKINTSILNEINKIKEIKKLQLTSCELTGSIDITNFTNLEELQLIYVLENFKDLIKIIKDSKVKKITISGDLVNRSSKAKINELKRKGIEFNIVGPVIK